MSTELTYPGVYVIESDDLAISVNFAATAVPIFALDNASPNTSGLFNTATMISSWLDWTRKKGSKDNFTYVEDGVLRLYFANGGGPCYVVSASTLAAQVPLHEDITLIVSAGQNISAQVGTLCQEGKGLFAILDGPKTEITSTYDPSISYTANPYAAVYYPWFTPSWANKPIPASGAMAGIYCSTDRTRGVWKAPANVVIRGGRRTAVFCH